MGRLEEAAAGLGLSLHRIMTHSDNTLMIVYLRLYIGDHTYISDGVMVIISSVTRMHDQ